ncbi:MAG: hypothetical protein AB8H80_16420 [Planctomycetota bacterium]
MSRRIVRCMLLVALAGGCRDAASGAPIDRSWLQGREDVAIRVAVAPTEVGLMQPVQVTIDRFRRVGVEVEPAPKFEDESWLLTDEVVGEEQPVGSGPQESGGQQRSSGTSSGWRQRTVLTLLPIAGPGEVKLPPFEIVVRDSSGGGDPAGGGDPSGGGEPPSAASEAKVVVVGSSLSDEHGDELEAPGDLLEAPFVGWWPWAAGAAAALLAAWLLVRRSRRGGNDRSPPLHQPVAAPAHVVALRELGRWREAPRGTARQVEDFYVGVSQVLRDYVEARFALHAPERTTEEFLRELEGSDRLVQAHRAELERFLSQCDLVKFAALVPSEPEHLVTWELAQQFVEATRQDRVGALEQAS